MTAATPPSPTAGLDQKPRVRPESGVALGHASGARRTMTLLTALVIAIVIVQGATTLYFGVAVRGRFTGITHDSVPSILAAQNLRSQAQDVGSPGTELEFAL